MDLLGLAAAIGDSPALAAAVRPSGTQDAVTLPEAVETKGRVTAAIGDSPLRAKHCAPATPLV